MRKFHEPLEIEAAELALRSIKRLIFENKYATARPGRVTPLHRFNQCLGFPGDKL